MSEHSTINEAAFNFSFWSDLGSSIIVHIFLQIHLNLLLYYDISGIIYTILFLLNLCLNIANISIQRAGLCIMYLIFQIGYDILWAICVLCFYSVLFASVLLLFFCLWISFRISDINLKCWPIVNTDIETHLEFK